LPAITFGAHSSIVRYWQSQYTVLAPMFITAHQGASPKARLGEAPNPAAAATAMPLSVLQGSSSHDSSRAFALNRRKWTIILT